MAVIEVVDEPGMRRSPSRSRLRQRARGGHVGGDEPGQPAEVLVRPLTGNRGHRQLHMAADRLGDGPGRDALVGDPVQHRSRRRRLQRQAKDARDVGPAPGVRPAVPEAMTSGRPEPAKAAPRASTARRSASAAPREVAREDEIVPVRGVDDPVGRGRAGTQDVEIVERSALHLRSADGARSGRGVRAGERDDPMARGDELADDGGADPAGGARDEDTHGGVVRRHLSTPARSAT